MLNQEQAERKIFKGSWLPLFWHGCSMFSWWHLYD